MPAGRPNRSYDIIIGSYGISNQVSSKWSRERENTIYPVFIYQQFPRLALAEMNGVRRKERKVAAL